jgi:hypothetical protein
MKSNCDYLKELAERRLDRLVLVTGRVGAALNSETYIHD